MPEAYRVTVSSDLTVLADRRRLEQALSNLVENALRHGRGKILIEASVRSGLLELRVADEGEGFEPSFIPRAFDRFSRGESRDGLAGVGLGLAIVGTVAEAHGGEAVAENRTTGGAVVTVVLPHAARVGAAGTVRQNEATPRALHDSIAART